MKDRIKHSIHTFWVLLRNVGFIFIIFLLAFVVFTVPDQADDFILAFVDSVEPYYYLSVGVFLLMWSFISWYSSSIILDITPIDPQNIQNLNTEKFNRFVGFMPFLILGITFFLAYWKVENKELAIIITVSTLVIGFLMTLVFKYLDSKNDSIKSNNWPSPVDIIKHQTVKGKIIVPTIIQEIKFILRFRNVRFYFITIGILALSLLILFCIPGIVIPVTQSLRPAAVIILSFCFITYVVTVLYYFHDFDSRPFVLYIVLWLMLCSIWNDNTAIPTIEKDITNVRLSPKMAFDKWYKARPDKWKANNDSMPVIFIATQGGGIRGELWTIECLNKLAKNLDGFGEQVFCIGGASGGTVGAVYNTAFWYDTLYNKSNTDTTYDGLVKFASTDCISPVTASFAFGEVLQHLIPVKIPVLDRSKVMIEAFSRAYQKNLQSSIIDSGLLSIYYPNYNTDSFNVHIPSIFINGVLAETGQRIITSNLDLSHSKNFEADIDFFECIREDISIATASLNCMRFPLLLSGGLFNDIRFRSEAGHMVDGGYRENTGLQAMYSLMCELSKQMSDYKVKPILLYIRNGNNELSANHSEAIRFMHVLRTPFTALMNVNGTSVPSLGIMKMIEQQKLTGNPMKMASFDLWLNNNSFESQATFPLGLYMSETATKNLQLRATQLLHKDSLFVHDLNELFQTPKSKPQIANKE